MRATRIAHRLEGFCRNGSRKATWLERRQIALSDAALRAIRMYPFRGLGHIIEGSNAESANAQVGERFNDANVHWNGGACSGETSLVGGKTNPYINPFGYA